MTRKTKAQFYIKLSKMPKSLNSSSLNDPISKTTTSKFRKNRKTTIQMVNHALTELHTAKGITLKKIHSYVKTQLNDKILTKQRINQIRKYLNELRESNSLDFVNSSGFTGHFKLIHKNLFKDGNATKASNVKSEQKIKNKNNKKKKLVQTSSMFDTPIISTHVDASSTPFQSNFFVPQAPEILKRLPKKRINRSEGIETPRSSFGTKKRRLHRRVE